MLKLYLLVCVLFAGAFVPADTFDMTIDIIDIQEARLDDDGAETVALIKKQTALPEEETTISFVPQLVIKDSKSGALTVYEPLSDDFRYAYGADMAFGDVDGDACQEIVVHATIAMSGGAGGFTQVVLKYKDGGITELMGNGPFDTGFSSELQNGNAVKIKNRFTGYEEVFRLNDDYDRPYFNADGTLTGELEDEIMVDTFYELKPVDIDGDGVSEIATAQYTSLWGHSDMIGSACSVLKYDSAVGAWKVIKTKFFEDFLSPETFDRVWANAG